MAANRRIYTTITLKNKSNERNKPKYLKLPEGTWICGD